MDHSRRPADAPQPSRWSETLGSVATVLVAVDERSTSRLTHDDDVTPLLRAAASLPGIHVAVVSDRTSQEVMVDTRLTGVAHLLGIDVRSVADDPAVVEPDVAVVALASELGVEVAVVVSTRRDASGLVEDGIVRLWVDGVRADTDPVCRCDARQPDSETASCLARALESVVDACASRRSR